MDALQQSTMWKMVLCVMHRGKKNLEIANQYLFSFVICQFGDVVPGRKPYFSHSSWSSESALPHLLGPVWQPHPKCPTAAHQVISALSNYPSNRHTPVYLKLDYMVSSEMLSELEQ